MNKQEASTPSGQEEPFDIWEDNTPMQRTIANLGLEDASVEAQNAILSLVGGGVQKPNKETMQVVQEELGVSKSDARLIVKTLSDVKDASGGKGFRAGSGKSTSLTHHEKGYGQGEGVHPADN